MAKRTEKGNAKQRKRTRVAAPRDGVEANSATGGGARVLGEPGLSGIAQKWFAWARGQLKHERRWREADVAKCMAFGLAMARLTLAERSIESHGVVYEVIGKSGDRYVKRNPACSVAHEAALEVRGLVSDLGLDPVGRHKIGEGQREKNESPLLRFIRDGKTG